MHCQCVNALKEKFVNVNPLTEKSVNALTNKSTVSLIQCEPVIVKMHRHIILSMSQCTEKLVSKCQCVNAFPLTKTPH